MNRTERRIAIVSGGARGIGAAVSKRLLADGLIVHVLDLTDGDGVNRVDVSDWESCQRAIDQIGAVDVLVNCAGIPQSRAQSWRLPAGEFERVIAVNLTGTYYMCRAVLPGMVSRGWGRIVNISSIAVKDNSALLSAYVASKAGVIALTNAIAQETASAGVLVNCIMPGAIDTQFSEKTAEGWKVAASRSPMNRLGTPSEVANMVAWLCSDECSFSTGAVFNVSGGRGGS